MQGLAALPAPAHVEASLTAPGFGGPRTTTQVGVSHAMLSVLVTHRARDPPIWMAAGAVSLLPTRRGNGCFVLCAGAASGHGSAAMPALDPPGG
jgi:hypothetical protein